MQELIILVVMSMERQLSTLLKIMMNGWRVDTSLKIQEQGLKVSIDIQYIYIIYIQNLFIPIIHP